VNSYELILVFNPDAGEDKINLIVEKLTKKIEAGKGVMEKVDAWGKKKLSFTFMKHKHLKDGYYVAMFFKSPSNVPKELENIIIVTEEIIRFLFAKPKKKALPTPIVEKSEEITEISPALFQTESNG